MEELKIVPDGSVVCTEYDCPLKGEGFHCMCKVNIPLRLVVTGL